LLVFTFEVPSTQDKANDVFEVFFREQFCPMVLEDDHKDACQPAEKYDKRRMELDYVKYPQESTYCFHGKILRKLQQQSRWCNGVSHKKDGMMHMQIDKGYRQVFLAFNSNPLTSEMLVLHMMQIVFAIYDSKLKELYGCEHPSLNISAFSLQDLSSCKMHTLIGLSQKDFLELNSATIMSSD
jgi:hypothetical protein